MPDGTPRLGQHHFSEPSRSAARVLAGFSQSFSWQAAIPRDKTDLGSKSFGDFGIFMKSITLLLRLIKHKDYAEPGITRLRTTFESQADLG
ncbi:MAG: hypothetical protein ACPG4Q_00175 [Phycisphaeraceae bacterium]